MTIKLTVEETTNLFHSYGLKCNQKTVEQWITVKKLKATKSGMSYTIAEDDAYEFLYDYRYDVQHTNEVLMTKLKYID